MPKPIFFNKGIAKGKLTKSEIVTFEKNGKGGEFLSLEIEAGTGNRIKATVFPTLKNARKHIDIYTEFPVGSYVEVSGNVQEREFESKSGQTGIDRSISAFNVKPMKDGDTQGAVFILHGIIDSIKETSTGTKVTLLLKNDYEKDGTIITRPDSFFHLESPLDLKSEFDIYKGCNVKFKGRILNELTFDDYGDITGNTRMFLIEKVENIVEPDELKEEDEDLPF